LILLKKIRPKNNRYSWKFFEGNISIKEKVKDEVLVRTIDKIVVKGKTKPIKVFELIGLKSDEKVLINDYKEYLKHEDIKDENVYVCHTFRNEVK
jgi:hypothetical protein